MKKFISIIVPIFNSDTTLDRCINSIINQTYKNIEIILVDDGSTDNSAEKCDEYLKIDSRIKVIHKQNGGVSSARNIGLSHATGDYIAFVDSDDYVENNMYELLIKCIEKNKSDIAISNVFFETPEKSIVHNYEHSDFNFNKENYPENSYFIKSISGYVCNKLYSRDMIYYDDESFISFNSDICIGEDDLFNYEIFDKNSEIKYSYIDIRLYHYILNNSSATNKKFNLKKLSYFDAKEKEINMLEFYKISNDFLKADYIINFIRTKIIINKLHLLVNEKYYSISNKTKEYKKQIKIKKLPFKLKIKLIISLNFPILYKLKLAVSRNDN